MRYLRRNQSKLRILHSVFPTHSEPQRDCALPIRTKSPTSLVVDVHLAVVHDIILTHRHGGTMTIESIESICAVHGLSPIVTESVVQVVMGDLSPVREQQRYVMLSAQD